MRVLLVEDERILAGTLERGLRREGMAVDVAFDGGDALEKAGVNQYDVVVLDRDLPRGRREPKGRRFSGDLGWTLL